MPWASLIRRSDIDLHCPVTLKVISERHLGDESARLRFLREARAAASVVINKKVEWGILSVADIAVKWFILPGSKIVMEPNMFSRG